MKTAQSNIAPSNAQDTPDHNLVPATLPDWLPTEAMRYLIHTETGTPIREIARQENCHASTVLRQIRRFENRRDDLLVDEALSYWGQKFTNCAPDNQKDHCTMSAPIRHKNSNSETLKQEARRILRRLCETGAVLAVAKDMEKAVVVRDLSNGKTARTAVVDRAIAQSMALKSWISCTTTHTEQARLVRYQITSSGRAALKHMLAEIENAKAGFGEAQAVFAGQYSEGDIGVVGDTHLDHACQNRYNMGESPLATLARRKDKDGKPFLDSELVAAGERLREDFELAQMGPKNSQNWEQLLTEPAHNNCNTAVAQKTTSSGARDRVSDALKDLGPGLGDVVLRCCCYLEGMEKAERRMGWSARSGKIVLRIALQRLTRHYQEKFGPYGPMIG